MLRLAGATAAMAALGGGCAPRARKLAAAPGALVGEVNGAAAGLKTLADGGNAIDAIVTAALVSCVAAPWQCGIGGYGGHATLVRDGGRKIVSLDFNSAAPAAARADMFPLDDKGEVKGRVNFHGWLAAGVPGTLAGLELALRQHGTKSFREVVQPALDLARDGVRVPVNLANMLRGMTANLRRDPGFGRLFLRDGQPLKEGDTFRNPELAALLTTLAERNSVESFYRGDIAQRIADGFRQNGGLVTAADLAAYRAREVEPARLRWRNYSLHTAPLTAGGVSVLETLAILQALNWDKLPAAGARVHAKLEALRLAWSDRLNLLGDTAQVNVPVGLLLSTEYAQENAAKVSAAVKAKQPLPLALEISPQDGTVNLSCADRHGNLVALTLTHGGSFGAQVAMDGLGLVLGHGMSRFNARPGHPNSPGPGKRPLNNMCPTVVLRDGRPLLALGGAGGVRIPNSMFEVLTNYVVLGRSLEDSIAAPRLHCTGGLEVQTTRNWPTGEADYLRSVGFNLKTGGAALIGAVEFEVGSGSIQAALR